MKCICIKKCFSDEFTKKPRRYNPGDIPDEEVKKCPDHFLPLEGEGSEDVDFATSGEAELLEREFDLNALKAFILKTYDKKTGNRAKDKMIEMLLDCRERDISKVNLDKL